MLKTAIAAWKLQEDFKILEPIELPYTPHSLDEATSQLPEGAYTTFRTYGRFQVLNLTEHINRLEETARLADRLIMLDRTEVKRALHRAFMEFPADQKRVRLILDLTRDYGTIYFLIETLVVPSQDDYENGVKVITRRMHRQNPEAKLTDFIKTADEVRQEIPEGIHEVIMLDEHQRVLEGLSSNFFAIKNGVVWTADEGILSGITRQNVLNIIQSQGIPIRFVGVDVNTIADVDEAFLTSTSRAVLPVREINGEVIDGGHPGNITRAIMAAFQVTINQNLEPV